MKTFSEKEQGSSRAVRGFPLGGGGGCCPAPNFPTC